MPADEPIPAVAVAQWAETLAAVGRTGLAFAESLYDRERYQEILHVAADMSAAVQSGIDVKELTTAWIAQIVSGNAGYITPRVAVGAFVGNENGELLLIQRADNHKWFIPTGWADVGYSPSEVVQKEVLEETGYEVVPERIVALLDAFRGGSPNSHWLALFTCKLVGGNALAHPLETQDIGWFREDNLPSPLFGGNPGWVELGFQAIRGEILEPRFDEPRPHVWRE